MGIFMPEKILTKILATGLTTIKGNLVAYVPIIFDSADLGANYLSTVTTYLGSKPVYVSQGYPLNDQRLPGWYVVPATAQQTDAIIGEYGGDDDWEDDAEEGGEIKVQPNQYSVKIITASKNGDTTLMLDAIVRFLMLSNRDSLGDYNMHQITVQSTDYDPIYQFLPDELQMRSTIISFQGFDAWVKVFPLIQDAQLFVRFNENEDYIEIP